MADMKGLVVVVTGGCRGIGFSISESFLARGATVVMADLSKSEAAESLLQRQPDTASFIRCDVTTDLETVCADVIAQHSRVDVLVNNAGIADESSPKRLLEINTLAVIEWTNRFTELMRTDKGGKGGTIINVASIYGFCMDPYLPIYKASKHAVIGFTRTVGHEERFKKLGVRIVALCPGYTKTELVDLKPTTDLMFKEHIEFIKSMDMDLQVADAVGKAAVEVYEKAKSGSAWRIESCSLSEVNYPSYNWPKTH